MTEPWSGLPPALADEVSEAWDHVFPEGVPAWADEAAGMGEEALAGAMARSLFLRESLQRHSELVRQAVEAHPLSEPTTAESLRQRWQAYLEGVTDEPSLHRALRRFRRESQFRMIWRDALKLADYHETVAAASDFADIGIQGRWTGFTPGPARSWVRPTAPTRSPATTLPSQ